VEVPDTTSQTSAEERAPEKSSRAVEHGILFFGDSITAGLGVSAEQAFPALIQEKIDSLGWSFEVVSAGVSGETSAGGLRRISWVMHEDIEVMVLELGGNDGLRGVPVQSTRENLSAIIDSARAINENLRILLAGMQVPPNLGSEYTRAFKNIYPAVASEKDVERIPFVLEGVGGNPALNQSDGIHPNVEGHRVIAATVWEYLKPVLQELRERNEVSAVG
jgi:acyl-CoA thioesterase-1